MLWIILVTVGFIGWGLPVLLKPVTVGAAIAPDPATHHEAVVQVYGADVWGFRGRYAIHTWIATKPVGAASYTIYQVIGWRLRRGHSVVSIDTGNPDRAWFGSEPMLLLDHRGEAASELIDELDTAARNYPYADAYTMWPGPNSNSFTAWVGLQVPQLKLTLPAKAVGKNWMESNFGGAQ